MAGNAYGWSIINT